MRESKSFISKVETTVFVPRMLCLAESTVFIGLPPKLGKYIAGSSPPDGFNIYPFFWFGVVVEFAKNFRKISPFVQLDENGL